MEPLEKKSPDEVKRIVEAVLFAVQEPISARKLSDIVGETDAKEIQEVIRQLREEYDTHDRVFQIEEIARWFRIPPHKLMDMTKSTFNNVENGIEQLYDGAVLPNADTLFSALSSFLPKEELSEKMKTAPEFHPP